MSLTVLKRQQFAHEKKAHFRARYKIISINLGDVKDFLPEKPYLFSIPIFFCNSSAFVAYVSAVLSVIFPSL